MLSGLTSQLGNLSGLIGNKQSKENPTDNPDGTESLTASTVPTASKTLATSSSTVSEDNTGATNDPQQQSGVFNSVRNHIPSWLGGSKFISGAKEEETQSSTTSGVVPPATDKGDVSPSKESDASSATEGADSEKDVANDEEDAEKGTAVDKVKNLGNFLFSTIKGAGQKIKETNILSEFQKEHDSFLKSRGSKSEAVAPWVGHPKEEAFKEEILALSTERRNFVRSPPSGVSFTWDWDEMAPVAKAILKEDPNLETMRYELVPKVITEEHFWRNYFYRVSLLKDSLSEDDPKPLPKGGGEADDEALEQELNEELRSFEVVGSNPISSNIDDKEIDALLDLK